MAEKILPKSSWFRDRLEKMLGNMRDTGNFTDITLACEDGNHVEAHKIVLAAFSPFFLTFLKTKKTCAPTCIYERDEV